MMQKKETSSSLAGRELAENKGVGITLCQVDNINSFCPSCKILLKLIRQQRMIFAAHHNIHAFDPDRKLLPAPKIISAKDKLHILQHSLGVDQYGRGKRYRNHFATSPGGGKDWDICQELVFEGLMKRHAPKEIYGGMYCFVVTQDGIDFVTLNSPSPPQLSKSKQRYRRYLEYGDGFDSFRDFLIWDSEQERSWNREDRCYA